MLRLRRVAHTAWLRLLDFAYHSRWLLLSLTLALVGVSAIWIDVPIAVSAILAFISLGLLWLEWRRHVGELQALSFIARDGDRYDDVAAAYLDSSRFTFVAANNQHVLLDRSVTRAIAGGGVTGRMASASYLLPHELKAGTRFRSLRIKRRDTYNGHLLGLDSNLDSAIDVSKEWRLAPARYWDHLASDIMATKIALRNGEPDATLGRALYVDRYGRLRDFGDSWLLNALGTSLLAITTDQKLVIVAQSKWNESSGELLAPSSSGSLEPQDFRGAARLDIAVLAANGALRELEEETGIRESDVAETAFLGFGRWIEKAAKPEMWTLARLDIDSHEVKRRRLLSHERVYTKGVNTVRLSEPARWDVLNPHYVLEGTDPVMLSVPLIVGLRLLVEERARPQSIAGEILRRSIDAR
ncbi:hypothetical protein H9L21_08190 [Aeromicrobium senzhongii]|uniref:Nudix hydrolase domain-containing protein n=1 Tax=Aeromicrobium senzhongii TaxID=2663859 RepID=A0ABX6SQ00_9ACTN|nr:hypothetical protein [Aeromicrobium senzhongii]MTB87055.1 hypothetical protein [Aeromicrobium senzhongii]QNL93126.1 hypothetical protein H9L21_08190 [Aeromicrobium senzhongii]